MPAPAPRRARRWLFARAAATLAAGLVPSLLAGTCGCGGRPASDTGGVLLVIIDTLRADHLGCYGYARDTSPHLDRLAGECARYESVYAQAPWTLPSVASILTGRWAHEHQARSRLDRRILPIADDVPTLAEWLRDGGFRTGAVINVPFLGPDLGVARGFEHFDFEPGDFTNRTERDAAGTTDAALRWLDGLGDERFFLVVHYFDPHLSYDPPAPYDTMFEPDGKSPLDEGWGRPEQIQALRHGQVRPLARQCESLVARYDGEIRYTDEQFGRLRRGLEERHLWASTLVVVTSDHGEEFWDHGGFEHGHTHHRELLHVPLLVKHPGRSSPTVSSKLARSIDIAPTILDFTGVEPPIPLPGRVLGRGGDAPYSLAEGSLWSGDLVSVRTTEATLIWNRTTGHEQLYRADDLLERENRIATDTESRDELEAILRDLPTSPSSAQPWQPDPAEIEELRSLGYVD